MKNLRQIDNIFQALSLQEQRARSELQKINMQIEKRLMAMQKISAYQKEYTDGNKYQLSHSIPLLEKNLYAFSQKISLLIAIEERELSKLARIKINIMQKITDSEKKINLMGLFKQRIISTQHYNEEIREQSQADDLSTLKSREQEE